MDREDFLKKLTVLDFMLLDLGLYLNVRPDDNRAIRIHNEVTKDAGQLRLEYERLFGPLTKRAENNSANWRWIEEPWPWQ
ncbi:MAG: spore coat protein CotJB [Defluviitaleaceae bacterium]|nr:spore coat protein CotJB [Defluviitaleaceae bacterium]